MINLKHWLPAWVSVDLHLPIRTIAAVSLLLIGAWILTLLSRRAVRLFRAVALRGNPDAETQRRVDTLARVFRYLANIAITAMTGMLVLAELGISIAPILGAAGIVGIAVGFGAQSLVKDFFTGFVLLLENQIRQGDVVTIAGRTGKVESVTLRNVRLRDQDGSVHFVPNSKIEVVTNQSMDYSFAVIDIGIDYRQDAVAVFDAMREVGLALRADPGFAPRLLADPEITGTERLVDATMTLRCRIKCVPLEQWTVRREYLRRLLAVCAERGVLLASQPPATGRDESRTP